MSKEPPYFQTEYKNRLFTVVGGNTIELPDGSKVVMNPDFVVSADYSIADDPVTDLVTGVLAVSKGLQEPAQLPHNNRPDNQPAKHSKDPRCIWWDEPGLCSQEEGCPTPDNQADLLEDFRNDFNHIGDGRILVEPEELAKYITTKIAEERKDELKALLPQMTPDEYSLWVRAKIVERIAELEAALKGGEDD